jgi:hypothetical protein
VSYGHTFQDFVLTSTPVPVTSGQARQVVTKPITVSEALATDFGMYIEVEGLTLGVGETITAWLQERVGPSDDDFADVGAPQGTVKLTTDGRYCIFLTTGVELEAMVLPLTNIVRLAIETGPGSSCTITSVRVWIKP